MLVSGDAKGVDKEAYGWAEYHAVPLVIFGADWTGFGRAAGPLRNRKMAEYGTELIAFKWRGRETPGTNSMITEAKKRGLPVEIILLEQTS
jgi:hypothetical protein